ncbi:hypothetical protein X760_09980 [Mesorhizobium sp. LSHC422A00]|nr:hypothetical protein X760_09980 [Mesorhizobium sp. LSHC422A00]
MPSSPAMVGKAVTTICMSMVAMNMAISAPK